MSVLQPVGGWFQSDPTRFLHADCNARLLGVPKWGPRTRVADGHTPDPLSDEDERFQPRVSGSNVPPEASQVASHKLRCCMHACTLPDVCHPQPLLAAVGTMYGAGPAARD